MLPWILLPLAGRGARRRRAARLGRAARPVGRRGRRCAAESTPPATLRGPGPRARLPADLRGRPAVRAGGCWPGGARPCCWPPCGGSIPLLLLAEVRRLVPALHRERGHHHVRDQPVEQSCAAPRTGSATWWWTASRGGSSAYRIATGALPTLLSGRGRRAGPGRPAPPRHARAAVPAAACCSPGVRHHRGRARQQPRQPAGGPARSPDQRPGVAVPQPVEVRPDDPAAGRARPRAPGWPDRARRPAAAASRVAAGRPGSRTAVAALAVPAYIERARRRPAPSPQIPVLGERGQLAEPARGPPGGAASSPGAAFGQYLWGSPLDDVLQPLTTVDWAERDLSVDRLAGQRAAARRDRPAAGRGRRVGRADPGAGPDGREVRGRAQRPDPVRS